MKPIDQLLLDIALSICAAGFLVAGAITAPGAGWILFAIGVLLYALLRIVTALHELVPGGFGNPTGGVIEADLSNARGG